MHDQPIVIYRFLRVVFGVTSSPFLLNTTTRHHLEKYLESEKDVVERLRDDLYVEDQVSGCETPDQGKLLDNKSNAIMNDAGFDLRKWFTNDQKLGKYIKAKEVEKISPVSQRDEMTYFESVSPGVDTAYKSVLGVQWDTSTDEFVFCFGILLQKCAAMKRTKRNLLSVSVSIFDPLGIISPVTARITTIFQLLCKDKRNWDDETTAEVGLVWARFLQELTDLKQVRVQRLVWSGISGRQKRVEVHCFSGSSEEVCCTVIYVRSVENEDVAKTKVAPLKTLSIPGLGLLCCLLLSKLINHGDHCFSGSCCCRGYLLLDGF